VTPRRTLPSRYYTDADLFARERERMFASGWVCIGRTEDVAAPGQFITREVAGESIVVTGRAEGGPAAFFNVCRHRGTRLCAEPQGRLVDRIQCPYHAWTYALDGRLLAAPHMDGADGFRKEDHGLHPVAVDAWDGHLFVNLSGTAPRLAGRIGTLAAKLAAWDTGRLRRGYGLTYDVRANWKLIVANYSECLHCPVIHPALTKLSPYMSGENDPATDAWAGGSMELRDEAFTMSRDGQQRRAPLPGLDERQRRHVYYYAVLPNLLLSLHPDYVMTHTLWPKACDRTEVVCEWHFQPDELARPTFDPGDVIDFWDETNRQDWKVSELSQLGIASRAYTPGPYSTREGLLWDLDQIFGRAIDENEGGQTTQG
jgi:Rieske 2Fe-2S family protein